MSSICRHVVFLWETCFTFCRVKIFRIFAEFHLSDWFKFLFLKKKTKGISRLKNVCRMHCRHISALHKCSKMLLFIDNILVLCTEYIYIYILGERLMEISLRRIKLELENYRRRLLTTLTTCSVRHGLEQLQAPQRIWCHRFRYSYRK